MTPPPIPPEIAAIGHLIRTQDNRATDAPLFIVQEQKRVYGFDPAYSDKFVWIGPEGGEADPEQHAQFEEKWQCDGERPEGWTRTHYKDDWRFVTACFTEQGCKDYIAENGHNHSGKLRVYAGGSYRNAEWRAVRDFLARLAGDAK